MISLNQKYMKKIKNLIVAPLIASAIFLASPTAFANSPIQGTQIEVRNISNTENVPNTKKGITGNVTSISGNIVKVRTKEELEYTVDISQATIMKEGFAPDENPAIVGTADIKIGDAIAVRGTIAEID
jgi:hypothetical protein